MFGLKKSIYIGMVKNKNVRLQSHRAAKLISTSVSFQFEKLSRWFRLQFQKASINDCSFLKKILFTMFLRLTVELDLLLIFIITLFESLIGNTSNIQEKM